MNDPGAASPNWARYAAAVAAELGATRGGRGTVETTLPVGAGLSSSAALEIAVALALGFVGSTVELALLCQRAEQRAVGVPCGVMDQLASAAGVDGHCLLIDCTTLDVTPVPVPADVAILVVDSRRAAHARGVGLRGTPGGVRGGGGRGRAVARRDAARSRPRA